MKNNFEEQVTDIYMSLLRREPDKAGLYYFVSQLKAEKLTNEAGREVWRLQIVWEYLRNKILLNDEVPDEDEYIN